PRRRRRTCTQRSSTEGCNGTTTPRRRPMSSCRRATRRSSRVSPSGSSAPSSPRSERPSLPWEAADGAHRPGILGRVPCRGRRGVLDMRAVEPGDSFEIGPYRVSTRLLPHWVPNMGVRLETNGLAFAYTGDTGPDPGIEDIARDADLLITEASWQDGHEAPQRYHLTSREAAEHAQRAEARRLLLSHF